MGDCPVKTMQGSFSLRNKTNKKKTTSGWEERLERLASRFAFGQIHPTRLGTQMQPHERGFETIGNWFTLKVSVFDIGQGEDWADAIQLRD